MASAAPSASLSGASAVADGATVDFTTSKRIVTAVIAPSPGVTDGMILVQASQDGVVWVDQAAIEVTGANRGYNNQQGAYRYWRANVLVEIVGGTVSAAFSEAG